MSSLAVANPEALTRLKAFNLASMRYMPQSAQTPVHQAQTDLIVINGGEGSGKSKTTSAEIASRYGTWDLVHLVCYKYDSAGNEADYLVEFLSRIGAVANYSKPKQGKLQIDTRTGGVIESISTEKEGERAVTGTGKSPDIIAMIEAGKQTYAVFLACLVRISRKGQLLILSGTVENSEPWYPDLINSIKGDNRFGAKLVTIPAWENRTLYPGGRDDPKIKLLEATLPDDKFKERIAGETVPASGLVYKEFSHVTHVHEWVRYVPGYPVEVAIDPGYSGSHYSVEFLQEVPRAVTRQWADWLPDSPMSDVLVIDELYLQYAIHSDVIGAARERPCWQYVTGGVGDVVMKTHPMAGTAPVEVWAAEAKVALRGTLMKIQDGIDRHRTFLQDPATKTPRIFFNPKCSGAIGEYTHWKRKEIGDNLYGDPEKINCDALKALHYWLVDRFGFVNRTRTKVESKEAGLRDQIRQGNRVKEDGRWMGEYPPKI